MKKSCKMKTHELIKAMRDLKKLNHEDEYTLVLFSYF